MLEGLKMGWVSEKPAGLALPSDDSHHGLNSVSPLLGAFVLFLYIPTYQVCSLLGVGPVT